MHRFLHPCVPPASSPAATHALNPHTLCSKLTSLHLVPRMPRFSWSETFLLAFLMSEVHLSALHKPGISENPISVEMPHSHLSCPVPSMIRHSALCVFIALDSLHFCFYHLSPMIDYKTCESQSCVLLNILSPVTSKVPNI